MSSAWKGNLTLLINENSLAYMQRGSSLKYLLTLFIISGHSTMKLDQQEKITKYEGVNNEILHS